MKFLIFFTIFLLFPFYAADKSPEFLIENAPSWVELANEEELSSISDQESANGIYYQLADYQVKKDTDRVDYYCHISKKVINQSGIDNAALIEIEFDPLCEALILHQVSVRRGNEVINQLKTAKIKILQREKSLERQHYTGKKSISIILDDVRVGDAVQYSFSIQSKYIHDNKSFYTTVPLSSSIFISCLKKRILWPKSLPPLVVKNHSTDLQPLIKQRESYVEYLWKKKDLPVEEYEEYTPIWLDNSPWVEVGEKLSWCDINLSLAAHYRPSLTLPVSIKKLIDLLKIGVKDTGERFIAVMRFVQDDIRYMGMSDRDDGFKPQDAESTCKRRFGDCKDKTYLAITMLNALEIEAYPALVHTTQGKNLKSRLPHPYNFNHVIIVAIINGQKYWIDPTYSFQGGTLSHYVQPDYGYALILDGKSQELTKMPAPEILIKPEAEFYETFDLSKGPGKSSFLSSRIIYKNGLADMCREYWQTTPKKELQEMCLKGFRSLYSSARLKGEIIVTDDRGSNIVTVAAEYEIPELWEREEAKKSWAIYTDADEFRSYLSNKGILSDRKNPVVYRFPRNISKKIEILLPEEWNEEDEEAELNKVIDPAFEFIREKKSEGRTYSVTYTYRSLKDYIDPKMVNSYIKNNEQALGLLTIRLRHYDFPLKEVAPQGNITSEEGNTLNWPILLILLFVLSFFIYVARRLYFYQPKEQLDNYENLELRGIKGWLLFPVIETIASPLLIIGGLYKEFGFVLLHSTWAVLFVPGSDSYNPLLFCLAVFETAMNMAFVVLWFLSMVLALEKKRFFPKLFVYILLGQTIFLISDAIMGCFVASVEISMEDTKNIVRTVIGLIAWGTYMRKSKRVKATFTQ